MRLICTVANQEVYDVVRSHLPAEQIKLTPNKLVEVVASRDMLWRISDDLCAIGLVAYWYNAYPESSIWLRAKEQSVDPAEEVITIRGLDWSHAKLGSEIINLHCDHTTPPKIAAWVHPTVQNLPGLVIWRDRNDREPNPAKTAIANLLAKTYYVASAAVNSRPELGTSSHQQFDHVDRGEPGNTQLWEVLDALDIRHQAHLNRLIVQQAIQERAPNPVREVKITCAQQPR